MGAPPPDYEPIKCFGDELDFCILIWFYHVEMQKHMRNPIPTFDQTLSAVDPLSNLVYRGLEEATARTRSFFADHKRAHDAFLAPCLMRFFAKHALRDSGIRAEEDGEASDFEGLPNNGLSFFFKEHHVRILKAATVSGARWKLPGCGVSDPKTQFYDQQLEFYFDTKNNAHSAVLNIVYLWDFDASFSLAGVYLGCPQASGTYAKDVRAHWCEAVPHPALFRPAEKSTSRSHTEDDLESLLRDQNADEAMKEA